MEVEAVELRPFGHEFPNAGLAVAISVLAIDLYGGEVLLTPVQQASIGTSVLFQRSVHDFLLSARGVVDLELRCQ